MTVRVSPKNIAIAVLGAAVIGLGTVVAVDRIAASTPPRTPAVAASTFTGAQSLIGTAATGNPAAHRAMANRIAQLFGLTPQELKTDIQNGQTLDQIAGAKDQSIKQEVMTYLAAELDKAVAKGAITAAQEASVQHDASDLINQLFAAQLGKLRPGG
jgi:hypothetical protein